jgi:hypothetical protein|tara:strand:- start:580 stop:810 length:231 start_codon:yes stop_codon:yes gene_type:complete
MKKLLILPILLITACSSGERTADLVIEKKIYQLTRQEVIHAIRDCQSANLRPIMYYGRVKAGGRPLPIVINVTCSP